MPDTPSVTLVKSFKYKGKDETFSNKYHFSGTVPTTHAGWKALEEAIWGLERTIMCTTVKLVAGYGYIAGQEHSADQTDFTTDLPAIPAGQQSAALEGPGDVTINVRWKTPDRSSKGRPIYLRKFFHGVPLGATDLSGGDASTQAATFAAKMIDGTLPGGVKLCGPQGAVASAPLVLPFVGFHQLKRRGKRPS